MNERHSSIGLRSGEYDGRDTSLTPLDKYFECSFRSQPRYIPCFTPLFNSLKMMNRTIINDKYTLRLRIRIHIKEELVEISDKFIAIVATFLDVAVDDAIKQQCRKD